MAIFWLKTALEMGFDSQLVLKYDTALKNIKDTAQFVKMYNSLNPK
jgi:hypothetical protein